MHQKWWNFANWYVKQIISDTFHKSTSSQNVSCKKILHFPDAAFYLFEKYNIDATNIIWVWLKLDICCNLLEVAYDTSILKHRCHISVSTCLLLLIFGPFYCSFDNFSVFNTMLLIWSSLPVVNIQYFWALLYI